MICTLSFLAGKGQLLLKRDNATNIVPHNEY